MKNNNSHPDLTGKDGSLAKILIDNKTYLEEATSTTGILLRAQEVLSTNNLDTPATKRFLFGLSQSKSRTNSLQLIWNTILSGGNLKTI